MTILAFRGYKRQKKSACCPDTTKKAKKLPFDKQKELINTLIPSLAPLRTENQIVPFFLGNTFNLWRFTE